MEDRQENVSKAILIYIITNFYSYSQMMDYLKHKDQYDLAIFFEDVVSSPEQEIKKIFDLMNIDYLHVPKALEALKEDSQRGTFGPRGKRPKISDEEYVYLDSCLRSCEVDERITCKMDLESLKELVEDKN